MIRRAATRVKEIYRRLPRRGTKRNNESGEDRRSPGTTPDAGHSDRGRGSTPRDP
jgi:hypothetical protein